MKAIFDPAEFAEAVAWTARHALGSSAGGWPILTGLLMHAEGAQVVIRASDGDVWVRATIPADVVEPGATVLPARLLADVAKGLPKAPVDLATERASATLTCGGLALEVGTQDPADFPMAPELPEVLGAVNAAELQEAVARVKCGVGNKKETAPFRSFGLLAGPALRLVATDRNRLPAADVPWQPTLDHPEGTVAALLPPDLADVAGRLPKHGDVTLHLGARQDGVRRFGLTWPGHDVVLPIVEAQAPPYGRTLGLAVPKLSVELDHTEVAAALRRVGATVERREDATTTLGVRLAPGAPGTIEFLARSVLGRAGETLEVDYDGPELSLRVNWAYLRDAVEAVGGERIRIGLPSTSEDPAKHRMLAIHRSNETTYIHIVMLVRYMGDAFDPWIYVDRRLRGAA